MNTQRVESGKARREVSPGRPVASAALRQLTSRFLIAIFTLLTLAVPAAATTITGTIQRPDGTPVTGTIEFVLSQQAKTTTPPILFAPVRTTCAVTNGQIAAGCTVQGNDTLDPAGTYYTVRVLDSNNRVVVPAANYTIAGASVDLGTLPVTATATLVPPSGNVAGNLSVTGNLTVGGSTNLSSEELTASHLRLLGLAADPATATNGSVFHRSDLNRIRFRVQGLQLFDGTQFVDITSSLPNTVDIGGDLRVSGASQLGFSADLSCASDPPGTPTSGNTRLYCLTSDKRIYHKDDVGLVAGPVAVLNQPQTWTAAQDFSRHNKIVFADTQPGADAGQQIANCIAALPATGGTCDARGLEGAQSFSSNPFAGQNKPVTLLTGAATYTWDTEAFAVDLPSNLTWIMNGTTLQTSAAGKGGFSSGQQGLLNIRTTSTTGSITSGTNTLTVASASNIDVGDLVGVVGAAGADANQRTTLSGAHSDSVQTLTVASTSGWGGANVLLLNGLELVSCTGVSGATFTACTRGAYGTTATSYTGGENVDAVGYFINPITAVSGTTITLEDNATKTVTSAPVLVGSSNISLRGRGVLDGRVNRAVPATLGLVGIDVRLASGLSIGPEVRIKGIEASGVQLNGSWRNQIWGEFEGNGRPAASAGFDIMVFGKSHYNEIKTSWHRDGNQAVTIDDRTTTYNLFSGTPVNNNVDMGPVVVNYTSGVNLQGAARTTVRTNSIEATTCITIGGGQWTSTVTPVNNTIYAGGLNCTTAIDMTVAAMNGNNAVHVPRMERIVDGKHFAQTRAGIQAAIDSLPTTPDTARGGVVIIPSNVAITMDGTSISITQPSVTLMCVGTGTGTIGASTLVAGAGQTNPIIKVDVVSGQEGTRISNCHFDGTGGGAGLTAIKFANGADLWSVVEDVSIVTMTTGISLSNGTANLHINRAYMDDVGTCLDMAYADLDMIRVENSNLACDTTVATVGTNDAVGVNESRNIIFATNHMNLSAVGASAASNLLKVRNVRNMVIRDNQLETEGGWGTDADAMIDLGTASSNPALVLIEGNHFMGNNNADHAVEIVNATLPVIIANLYTSVDLEFLKNSDTDSGYVMLGVAGTATTTSTTGALLHVEDDRLLTNQNMELKNSADAPLTLKIDPGAGVNQNAVLSFMNGGVAVWDIAKLGSNNDFVISENSVATQLQLRAGSTSFLRSGSAVANVILGSSTTDRVIVEGSSGNLLPSAAGQNLGSSSTPWADLFAQNVTISSGVASDSGGFKHQRASTGSIAAGESAAVTLTWTTPFADANYTLVGCEIQDSTAATLALRKHHIESKTAAAVIVRIVNDDGDAAHSGTLHCTAVHD